MNEFEIRFDRIRKEEYRNIRSVRDSELRADKPKYTPEAFRIMSKHVFDYDEGGNKIKKKEENKNLEDEESKD